MPSVPSKSNCTVQKWACVSVSSWILRDVVCHRICAPGISIEKTFPLGLSFVSRISLTVPPWPAINREWLAPGQEGVPFSLQNVFVCSLSWQCLGKDRTFILVLFKKMCICLLPFPFAMWRLLLHLQKYFYQAHIEFQGCFRGVFKCPWINQREHESVSTRETELSGLLLLSQLRIIQFEVCKSFICCFWLDLGEWA